MRTGLVVVTGVDPTAIDATLVALAWDLPRAVTVRHRIDPEEQLLTRVVSDATGVIERQVTHLEHACVTCALREDVLPTIGRLARDPRWDTVVSALPAGFGADHLCAVLGRDAGLARWVRVAGVVATLAADDAEDVLLGSDLLAEHGWHTGPDDRRGLGEVACAQVELADLVVLHGRHRAAARDLVAALARPDTLVLAGVDQLDGPALAARRHSPREAAAWRSPVVDAPVPPLRRGSLAWRIDLSTTRPFHPDRLAEDVARLGGGRHRSRGCFWVPTRPGDAHEWSGAGGQLSIGHLQRWGVRPPRTRLLLTGLGRVPTSLVEAFEDLLVRPEDETGRARPWAVVEDGLEPWLGDIRDVA
ncbi:GTP-binding protein [Lapillicoccus jejuensis]|uniref:G3E family GTPase n=1 Tax=Lapillicoccus jejuensis TaxID=402171 RepID=A0A542DVE9_9MICO|nr:GTP-binding protein [Lapillicoccus jejuensis]TQJ07026.1 G3E family GTPase [Lapillicoccus jejuensis]